MPGPAARTANVAVPFRLLRFWLTTLKFLPGSNQIGLE